MLPTLNLLGPEILQATCPAAVPQLLSPEKIYPKSTGSKANCCLFSFNTSSILLIGVQAFTLYKVPLVNIQ